MYEAREDPTKVQAYVDGLKAEINKVGNTALDRRERQRYTENGFSRTSISSRLSRANPSAHRR